MTKNEHFDEEENDSKQKQPDYVMDVLTELNCIRKIKSLKYHEIAKECDTTVQTISRLFSGDMTMSLKRFLNICNAMGVPPSYALGFEEQKHNDIAGIIRAIDDHEANTQKLFRTIRKIGFHIVART